MADPYEFDHNDDDLEYDPEEALGLHPDEQELDFEEDTYDFEEAEDFLGNYEQDDEEDYE